MLDRRVDQREEPSEQPGEEGDDLADQARVAELEDGLEAAHRKGEARLLLVRGPLAQLGQRCVLGAAVLLVDEVEEMEALKVAKADMPDGQLLAGRERGRRPARDRRLHAVLEFPADGIDVHGDGRERTL